MGKYSSDSDSDKRGKSSSYKSRPRHRSSSSSSSADSRSRKRKRKSRETYKSSRRSRSSSPHRARRRSKDRSSRYKRTERHYRSRRSRSRSYIREYASKARRHSTTSSSGVEEVVEVVDEVAARRSPETARVDVKTLNAINEEGFVQKHFTSKSKKMMMDNIVIDLRKQTIKVPEVEPVEPDSIFHHNLFLNEEARMEKWIKELYGYRQKALQQGLKGAEKV